MLHNMWHTCQLIMIVSLDIVNNNQIRCHSLGFSNVTVVGICVPEAIVVFT